MSVLDETLKRLELLEEENKELRKRLGLSGTDKVTWTNVVVPKFPCSSCKQDVTSNQMVNGMCSRCNAQKGFKVINEPISTIELNDWSPYAK